MKKVYFLFLLMVSLTATAQDGWVYSDFDPQLPSSGKVVAKDYATDKLYVSYYKSSGNGWTIERRNATTGAVDNTFNIPASFSSPLTAMLVQSDGKLIVAGIFYDYNGNSNIKRLVRFTTTGTIDTTFNPAWNTFQTNLFNCVAMAENGTKIVLGGSSSIGNVLYQINKSNGTMDTTFNTNAAGISSAITGSPTINAIHTYAGNIIIGGEYTAYTGHPIFGSGGTLCKISSTGTLVSGYTLSGYSGTVNALDVQSDGKVVFTGVSSTSVPTVARLNSNGSLDTTFTSPTITGSTVTFIGTVVSSIQVQDTGKVLFAGDFTTVNGVSRNDIARVTSTGAIDPTFDPGAGSNSFIYTITLDSMENLYVNGAFSAFGSYTRDYLVKISTSIMGRPALETDTPQINDNKVSVFPNPSEGLFNLQIEGYEGETFDMTVFNTLGQTVIQKTLSDNNNYQLDLTGYTTGNYFVRLQNNNTVINKIIVKK